LGLAPSATLILVPVKEFTSAYEDGGTMGLLYTGASVGYGFITGGMSWVTGTIGSVLGAIRGNAPLQSTAVNSEPAPTLPSARINVRTLQDQQPREDQQFYNGNAV
jgi:hypothetical protein